MGNLLFINIFYDVFLSLFLWGTILRLLSLGQGSVKYNLKS